MKNQFLHLKRLGSMALILLIGSSCSKSVVTLEEPPARLKLSTNLAPASDSTTLLVDVNYESGTKNSGIPDLTTTHASADSAEYVVSSGRTGDYAIAHKVVVGDSSYFSDNHWRSEAATSQLFDDGKYYNGDERRFETSFLLKDWVPYTTAWAANGAIIFQGKQNGGGNPAWYLNVKRNTITFRLPYANIEPKIINDFRPYINQWIDIRIDAKMTTDTTGYYKVYCRLQGESAYTLKWEINNIATFNQAVTGPTPSGYLKWGLYLPASQPNSTPPEVPTRIIYHDDIKIYRLH
ncbi:MULTISPECIES: heparin lyase I family protein [Sphingobacterium]|jgi:hypothetical protein|uniref:heparin lyase I family protein n=1 Tax=Sphingobacterium TaxID=28453 RepID=UPI00135B768E|nr:MULTISPECIES: heparin lyase I family protein [Sphingobacterium]